MEEIIRKIIKKEFDAKVIEVKSTTGGFSHKMFEVKINKEPYAVMMRFSNNKNEDVNLEKEKYVIELMNKNLLPVPKIYAFDNSCKIISEGYMILEKFLGVRLDTIWESLTKEEKIQITKEIGKLLSKIHSIKFEKFGTIKEDGNIRSDVQFKFKTEENKPLSYSPYLREELKDNLEDLARLISHEYLPKKFFINYITFLCNNLEILDYHKKPVLIHGDFMTGHLFIKKENSKYKIVGLIDFEFAKSSSPSDDFIKLHRQGFFDHLELKKALEKGYGKINEKSVEILRIMRDVGFAQVLFASGDRHKAENIIQGIEKKIRK